MYRVIITAAHKSGHTTKIPYDFTSIDKALLFIREADMANRKNFQDFFHEYELFYLKGK